MKNFKKIIGIVIALSVCMSLSMISMAETKYETTIYKTTGKTITVKDEQTNITAFTSNFKQFYYVKNNTLYLKTTGSSSDGTAIVKGKQIYHGYASGGYVFVADEEYTMVDNVSIHKATVYYVKIGSKKATKLMSYEGNIYHSFSGKSVYLPELDENKNIKITKYTPGKAKSVFVDDKSLSAENETISAPYVQDGYVLEPYSIVNGTEYTNGYNVYSVSNKQLKKTKFTGQYVSDIISGYAYSTVYDANGAKIIKTNLSSGKTDTIYEGELNHYVIVGKSIFYSRTSMDGDKSTTTIYKMNLNGEANKKLKSIVSANNEMIEVSDSNGMCIVRHSIFNY